MREIHLTKGFVAVVDDEDYERANQHGWKAVMSRAVIATRSVRQITAQTLGQFLFHDPEGYVTRLTTNPKPFLDYRKQNLVLWPDKSLEMHRSTPTKRATAVSGYRGVKACTYPGRWQARYGAGIHLGVYWSPEEAAHAYDRAVFAKFGQYAILNFPEG